MGIADYERDYASAPLPERTTGHDRLPDGDYVGRVEAVEEGQTRSGDDCVTWTITITEGPHARRKVWHRRLLRRSNEKMMGRFKADLELFGLGGIPLAQVARRLSECVGATVEFRLATRGEWQNSYLNAVRPEPAASLPPTVTEHAPAPVDDDDIPF